VGHYDTFCGTEFQLKFHYECSTCMGKIGLDYVRNRTHRRDG
jgi:hypothetical protein